MDETNTTNQASMQPNAANLEVAANSVPQEEHSDISRTTIAVLVLLTLMISIIGTWTVLNEISAVKTVGPEKPSSSIGQVQMRIVSSSADSAPLSATTGKVSLKIEK